MRKNNYFYYTNEYRDFLYYLLSFAMEQYQDEDPLLSGCAKELIRYILGMDEMENVVVAKFDMNAVPGYDVGTVTVNHDKFILIDSGRFGAHMNLEDNIRNWYFVHYAPFTNFTMVQSEGLHVMYLSMKKLREICGKYPSKNLIFQQYIHFLEEQASRTETTLQTPIKQWDEEDYQRFSSHLVEDSIIDMTRSVVGERIYWSNSKHSHGLLWYYIPDDKLEAMDVRDHVHAIFLDTRLNTINISYRTAGSNEDNDPYVQKLRNFVRKIHKMPIFFALDDYKEKIQYAQSIMDRLVEEFRL